MKEFVKVVLHISCTGSGGTHHRPVLRKIPDKFFAYGFGLFPESAVESYLSATGLVWVVMHLMPELLKDPDHIKSRFREKLINKARNEDIDGHGKNLSDKNRKK
jgi:hypothetical protein